MGRPCTKEETVLLISKHNKGQEEEEEDEVYDLPVNSSNEKVQFRKQSKAEEEEEEFEFETGSSFRLGSDSCEPAPEMSTAEDLFFQGKILPFRPGSNRLIYRSESVDFYRTGINSSGKFKNNYIDYTQPSPQTHIIRRSSSMTARVNHPIRNSKSSSIWDFLRLGLVRTPEIELRTAKSSVSRNSSCSSTSTSPNSNSKRTESKSRNRRRSCKSSMGTETIVPVCREKEKKKKKTAVARKRTFEWLKELSQSHRFRVFR
ncbi:unnamed protein product [Eruca vesicaria subsp. sativa]|uniref:Uncharacterized protein n=1 Tax=Eruca vesicaria subsp. sativa TaxID=29727 RepID=A0ABC8JPG3_ERUVS|nr:unnamed protein product [Eruca vesicaria subsp. sativa]